MKPSNFKTIPIGKFPNCCLTCVFSIPEIDGALLCELYYEIIRTTEYFPSAGVDYDKVLESVAINGLCKNYLRKREWDDRFFF